MNSSLKYLFTCKLTNAFTFIGYYCKKNVFRMSKIAIILQHWFNNFPVFRSKFITPLYKVEKISSFIKAGRMMLYIKLGWGIHIQDETCNSVQLFRTNLLEHVPT